MTVDATPDRPTAADDPDRWTRARLIEPTPAGFVHIGVSSGPWRLPIALPRRSRGRILERLHAAQRGIEADARVVRADVFRALLRPPGGGRAVAGVGLAPVAYDAVMLIETVDVDAARSLRSDPALAAVVADLRSWSDDVLVFTGGNVRHIGPVDHERQGVFLFNYFTADDLEDNLFAWQYTAGWFQDRTGLDNSTVLQPEAASTAFTLVNHCRWDRLRDVVPTLVFERSFRRFVLRVFAENRVAPHPILYRLHRRR